MTDTTGNHRIRPPKLAISRSMIDAGKAKMNELTELDPAQDIAQVITDDLLCAEMFLAMWNVYWNEIMEVQRKKDAGSPIVQFRPSIIRPL